MAFGLNKVQLIGRLGGDVTVNHLTSGGRVANLSIATDESYINRQTGEKVDKTEWHRVVTFQDPRGPCRVHDRNPIREVAEQRVLSHPLWG